MTNTHFRYLSVLFFATVLASTLWAQQPFRRCATVEYNKQQEQNNPALAQVRQDIKQLVQQHLSENSGGTRAVVTIPVVIHVIYNVNIQNIPDAQIYSQIDVLNKDFGRTNSDASLTPDAFDSVAVNTGIQFCLATVDSSGNPTTGIERRQNTSVTEWTNDDQMKYYVTGGLDAWDSDQYLNIWVCNLTQGFLGYTQLPAGNPETDGCVITSRAFGDTLFVASPFHLGRTTTHEVGHWLGLNHIWGDDSGLCPWDPTGNDDGINDTPPQANNTIGCPTFPVYDDCSFDYPGTMFMNYMDYTDDACMNMFTQEQAILMNTVLATVRAPLLTSNGCGLVGMNEAMAGKDISVYPNPADRELKIENGELKIKSFEILDVLGRRLLSQRPARGSRQLNVDVSSLDSGTYFVKITSADSVRTARFTIAR